jgi:hypothetical protein
VLILRRRLNRCCLSLTGDKIERGRSLVTSMSLHYDLGVFIDAMSAMYLTEAYGAGLGFWLSVDCPGRCDGRPGPRGRHAAVYTELLRPQQAASAAVAR